MADTKTKEKKKPGKSNDQSKKMNLPKFTAQLPSWDNYPYDKPRKRRHQRI